MTKRIFLILIALILCGTFQTVCVADNGDVAWLQGTFEEVNSASPVIGKATMPLSLVQSIVEATPNKYLEEAKESGFDISAILLSVEAMQEEDHFELVKGDYRLAIHKYTQPAQSSNVRYLYVRSENFSVPIPLSVTKVAVSVLQYAFSELDIDKNALSTMIEEIKKTPSGMILDGEDKLMEAWLKVRLE